MLSLLSLSIDRYQILARPQAKRFPIQVVLPLVWILSLAMVLPYMAYISHFYLDVSWSIVIINRFILFLYSGSWSWL